MKNNIFNINSNYNFLESLSYWILRKENNYSYRISDFTLFLPNRRSCREIKPILLKQAYKKSILLPKIKAIGDIDCSDIYLAANSMINLELPKVIPNLQYHLLMISEIKKWNNKFKLFNENITTDQVSIIADNLQNFLNEFDKENIDINDIGSIDDNNEVLSLHKQKIIKFIKYFGIEWQNILLKKNIISELKYRYLIINKYSQYLKQNKSNNPIILAGSTGSSASSANLIKAIAELDNGEIILYGLDKNLPSQIWKNIQDNHPQFLLKKLLEKLHINNSNVLDIKFDQFKQVDCENTKLVSNMMLPINYSNHNISYITKKSFTNLSIIEAQNDMEEAEIITSLVLSNLKHYNLALITNNKNLKTLVRSNLNNLSITIDDSDNQNLSLSNAVYYLLSITSLFEEEFNLLTLLSILKNPITRLGFDEMEYNKNLTLLETKVIRSDKFNRNLSCLKKHVILLKNQSLEEWFNKIYSILKPLENLFLSKKNTLQDILNYNIKSADLLSVNYKKEISFHREEGYNELMSFTDELLNNNLPFKIESNKYSTFLKRLLSDYRYNREYSFNPKLHILSTIEARLMNYDVMIVSSLNEGKFPLNSDHDNLIGRKIRKDFQLPNATRKIGVAAYDFSNYLLNKKVILSSSKGEDNTPKTKSKLLLKLEAFLKTSKLQQNITYLSYNQKKYIPLNKITRPKPCPKFIHRPKKISVTDIEKWLRDPYYIYARKILKLIPIIEVNKNNNHIEFGNFIHESLEKFIINSNNIVDIKELKNKLITHGKEIFVNFFPNDEDKLIWWPKFLAITDWVINQEISIKENLDIILTETKIKTKISNIELTARIDRINFFKDLNLEIIDYKTGKIPSNKEITSGLASQMIIEALILILEKNSKQLNNVELPQILSLKYWHLKGKDNQVKSINKHHDLINKIEKNLIRLFTSSLKENNPYISCPNYKIYKNNDYSHLSRIDEWSTN